MEKNLLKLLVSVGYYAGTYTAWMLLVGIMFTVLFLGGSYLFPQHIVDFVVIFFLTKGFLDSGAIGKVDLSGEMMPAFFFWSLIGAIIYAVWLYFFKKKTVVKVTNYTRRYITGFVILSGLFAIVMAVVYVTESYGLREKTQDQPIDFIIVLSVFWLVAICSYSTIWVLKIIRSKILSKIDQQL